VFGIYTKNYAVSNCSNRRTYRRVLVDGAVDSFLAALLIIASVYFGVTLKGQYKLLVVDGGINDNNYRC